MTEIKNIKVGTLDGILLEDYILRLVLLPQLGGKVISLIYKPTGKELLFKVPKADYRIPRWGEPFVRYDTGGWDECFPTIAPCLYPEGIWKGTPLPDHGALWSIPWHCQLSPNEVYLAAKCMTLPLLFRKRIRLVPKGRVKVSYEVENLCGEPLIFLWAAHLLLRITDNWEILLPSEVDYLRVNWSKGERLGKLGEKVDWPIARDSEGREAPLHTGFSPAAGYADKLFTPRLSVGAGGMWNKRTGESLVLNFPADLVPFIGLWLCQGGYPEDREPKHFTAGIEPSTGAPDSLEVAYKWGEYARIGARSRYQWWLELKVAQGEKPRL